MTNNWLIFGWIFLPNFRFGKDERYKGIEKSRERESLFNEFMIDIKRKDKEERAQKREQAKKDFMAMLKELATDPESGIDRHSRWTEVKKKFETESRYKAVDSSTLREDFFLDFVHDLKEEHRKKKKEKKAEKRSRSKSPAQGKKGRSRSRSRSRRRSRSRSPKEKKRKEDKKTKKDKRDRSRDRGDRHRDDSRDRKDRHRGDDDEDGDVSPSSNSKRVDKKEKKSKRGAEKVSF